MNLNDEEEMKYQASRWTHWAWGHQDVIEHLQDIEYRLDDPQKLSTWINFIFWIMNVDLSKPRNKRDLIKILVCATRYAPFNIFKYLVESCTKRNKTAQSGPLSKILCPLVSQEISVDELCYLVNQYNVRLTIKTLQYTLSIDRLTGLYDHFILTKMPYNHTSKVHKIFFKHLLERSTYQQFRQQSKSYDNALKRFSDQLINSSQVYQFLIEFIPVRPLVLQIIH